jgi:4-amino-4-deoxy-L-arabinose transferase-like glycosyltransferase
MNQYSTPHARGIDRFWAGLLAISTGAIAFRLWYALTIPGVLGGDQNYYHQQANLIADGRWFVDPFRLVLEGQLTESALHPPLWPLLLSVSSWIGETNIDSHRVVGCAVGTGTVVVLGLVGRHLVDDRTGLVVAGLASVYPDLWLPDGTLEAETLFALLLAFTLLAAYRWNDEPTRRRAAVLGVVIALATLTRAEGLLLLPLLAAPLMLFRAPLPRRTRLAALSMTIGVAALPLVPWVVYNASRFDAPVLISTNGDVAISQTNCKIAYSGPNVGYYSDRPSCEPRRRDVEDEAQWAARIRRRGLAYARDHIGELPRVVTFRFIRQLGLYKAEQQFDLASVLHGRDTNISRVGFGVFALSLPLAIGGAVILRRRGQPLVPLLSLVFLSVLSTLVLFAEIRFRVPAELAVVVLAGVFLSSLLAPRAAHDVQK